MQTIHCEPLLPNLMKKAAHASVGMALLLLSSWALAQNLSVPKVSETYIGGNFGTDLDQRMTGSSKTGDFQQRDIAKSKNFMVRWGYREEKTYAVEVGYQFMPSWNATSTNGSRYEQKGQGFFADVFLFFPVTHQASVYLKVGTGRMKVSSTVQNADSTFTSVDDYSSTPTAGIGLEYLLNPGFAVRGGWEAMRVKGADGITTRHGGFNVGGLLFYE